MKLRSVEVGALAIPFKAAFKHASAERATTQALWVEARASDGMVGYGEGCPREYVTSESLAGARSFVHAHVAQWLREVEDIETLARWVERNRAGIHANPAAWTAVEISLLDVIGRAEGRSVESLLGLPELAGTFAYTAVLGDAPPRVFEAQLARYLQDGFRSFKIKLSGDPGRDVSKTELLASAGVHPDAVRADANNVWTDPEAAIGAIAALDFPFFALEEPLGAGDLQGMRHIADALHTRIILDESLLRAEQLSTLDMDADRWIVNLRVSKMGGLLRSLDLVRELRRRGLRIVVGAHVGETSVLTRAALVVAATARDILVGQEGAFGTHLLARDVAHPPVMFGPGGVLDAGNLSLTRAGFGLAIAIEEADLSRLDSSLPSS